MDKKNKNMPPVIILCGGQGTRLRDVTEILPKPMVSIGEQPIVWHIMKTFASFGVRRFILCLGYKKEAFIDYFMNYHLRRSDATITLGHTPEITFHGETDESDWQVTLAGTGLNSMTGCRIFRASKYLKEEDDRFFLTYGDGLCDINLDELLTHHIQSKKLMTVTAVRPEARFGEMLLDGNNVVGFEEKPPQGEGYINGGYMVIDKKFIGKYLEDDENLTLEQTPMRAAAENGEMGVFKHNSFWQCMDNQREYALLNSLWERGNAPWTKHWK